jgi:hypothetical protein
MRNEETLTRVRELVLPEDKRTGIQQAERIAYWLDEFGRIPFTNYRIGLDPLIGVIPWLGDTFTAGLSIYLIGTGLYYGLPKIVILRMSANVAFDFLLGLVPYAGDVADFFVRANRRNLRLLLEYAGERTKPRLSDWLFAGSLILILLAIVASTMTLSFWLVRQAWLWLSI